MDENQKKALREMVCNFDESMKNAMDTLKDIFRVVDPLINPEKSEETPKKTLKKTPKKGPGPPKPIKAKSVEKKEVQEEIITLNMDAPISYNNCEDKGYGKIDFDILEDDSNGGGAGTQSKKEGIQAVLLH
jgi:hypothetical protein